MEEAKVGAYWWLGEDKRGKLAVLHNFLVYLFLLSSTKWLLKSWNTVFINWEIHKSGMPHILWKGQFT